MPKLQKILNTIYGVILFLLAVYGLYFAYLDLDGTARAEARTGLVLGGAVIVLLLLIALEAWWLWVVWTKGPHVAQYVQRVLTTTAQRVHDRRAIKRAIDAYRSYEPWLWLREPGAGEVEEGWSADGWHELARWLWPDARMCRGIEVAAAFPPGPVDNLAFVGIITCGSPEGAFRLSLRGDGTVWFGQGEDGELTTCIAEGMAPQHWTRLRLDFRPRMVAVSVNGRRRHTMVDDYAIGSRQMRAKVRTSAHTGHPLEAVFAKPRVW
jgi:hypothetical protein